MTTAARTRVAIIGAGPAGIITAIELGRRGVPVTVLEEDVDPPRMPKANATTARTMEHYRRLGFSRAIRSLGLPADYRQDVAYFTRFATHELARLPGSTRGDAERIRAGATSRWPTPEPLHRAQQMFIEPVLLAEARKYSSIDLRLGWRALKIGRAGPATLIEAVRVSDNATLEIKSDYLVGCEGPRSLTRDFMGVEYSGLREEEREFLGGRMLSIYFDSPAFYAQCGHAPAWQYWAFNPQRRGIVVAIDGYSQFGAAVQLARGQVPTETFASECLGLAMGRSFPHRIIGTAQWTAGYTLVAERLQDESAEPRSFLVGDSAHLFTPTGGQGYNTAVDDAANLGWKLAAVCQGWGGSLLLQTYEAERKPIAHRNTQFARAMAESIGRLPVPPHIEDATKAGEQARQELGLRLRQHAEREFDIPGIHLGVIYSDSPIVANEGLPPPSDDPHRYVPNTTPGARAPHVWVSDDVSLFDRFGRDFTLVCAGRGDTDNVSPLMVAARGMRLPCEVIHERSDEVRDIYGFDYVLVRPDHHIAWRGNAMPDDCRSLLKQVTGHPTR